LVRNLSIAKCSIITENTPMVAQLEDQPPKPKRIPKAERLLLIEHSRRTVGQVGFYVAADMLGVNHWTLRKWAERYHWQGIPKHAQALDASKLSKSAAAHDETLGKINKSAHYHYAVAALKAGVTASELSGEQLMERNTAMAFNQNTQAADRALGWTSSRTAAPVVQIANVTLPTPQEQAERQAMFAKLEEITRRLAAPSP
jgi:hypothetical protein